ncbi:MAG: hypothetical protein HZB85_02495 [Deltaproteobacteria bacterium]|nr:hypothetical protein [Deltaproteobacteria bacterium]
MERFIEGRRFHLAVICVITVFVIAAYFNTFHAAFQFDDLPSITQNQQIKNLGNISGILKSRRPVTQLTFAVNYAIGGTDPFGYHLVNTAIHILTSIAVYFLVLAALGLAGGAVVWSRLIAGFSALIFAVHPIQTQAVTYIVQRMESLASLFFVLAILIFIKACKAKSIGARFALYACVLVAYVLGFYSKEIIVTLPVVILLFDIWFFGGGRLKQAYARWPMYAGLCVLLIFFVAETVVPLAGFGDLSKESAETSAPAAPSGGVGVPGLVPPAPGQGSSLGLRRDIAGAVDNGKRQAAPGKSASAGFNVVGISPKEYLYTQFNVIVYYITLLAVPVNQNVDYDFPVARRFFSAPQAREGAVLNIPMFAPAVSCLILLVIAGFGVWLFVRSRKGARPRSRVISFFIAWFFIILAPTSSIVPIIDVIFEHRVYLASLGFFVSLVIFIDWLSALIFNRQGA